MGKKFAFYVKGLQNPILLYDKTDNKPLKDLVAGISDCMTSCVIMGIYTKKQSIVIKPSELISVIITEMSDDDIDCDDEEDENNAIKNNDEVEIVNYNSDNKMNAYNSPDNEILDSNVVNNGVDVDLGDDFLESLYNSSVNDNEVNEIVVQPQVNQPKQIVQKNNSSQRPQVKKNKETVLLSSRHVMLDKNDPNNR